MTIPSLVESLGIFQENYEALFRELGQEPIESKPKRYVLVHVFDSGWNNTTSFDTFDQVCNYVTVRNLFSRIRFVRDLLSNRDVPFSIKMEMGP